MGPNNEIHVLRTWVGDIRKYNIWKFSSCYETRVKSLPNTSSDQFGRWSIVKFVKFALKSQKGFHIISSLIARFVGPTWGPSGADRTQVSPMLAPRISLSGIAITTQALLHIFRKEMNFIKWMGHYRAQLVALFVSGFKVVSYVTLLTYIMIAPYLKSSGVLETVALLETIRVSVFYVFIFGVPYSTELISSITRMQVRGGFDRISISL